MVHDTLNNQTINEVLFTIGDVEIMGSGKSAAEAIMPQSPNSEQIMKIMESIIQDPTVSSVGGNIQFGSFKGTTFRPAGVATRGNSKQGVHYWRGPLDLNGPEFDQDKGLLPRFPLIDRI